MQRLFSFLIIVLILSLFGCQESKNKSDVLSGKQPDLRLAVSARFLRNDDSWYLTGQQHEISIEPQTLTISAQEPFGKIIMLVRGGKFNLRQGAAVNVFDKELIKLMTDEEICKSLLEVYLAKWKNSDAAEKAEITTSNKRYILSGYNYVKFKQDGYFPSKIDVYTYEGTARKLLAQYEGIAVSSDKN